MDIKQLEEMREPSAMKMARENQARLDSLASATGARDNLLKIVQNLGCSKKLTGNIVTQDLLSQLSQAFPHNSLAIDSSLAGIVNNLAKSNPLSSSVFESIKFNKAIIDSFEATHLGLKPRTQFIFPEGFTSKNQIGDLSSVVSKAKEVFKQYEQFGDLESFKALRLKNFPNNEMWSKIYHKSFEITEESIAEAKNIDAMISDEVSSVDDFNDLSEATQKSLKKVFSEYYDYFIIEVIVSLSLLQESLDKDLDLSSKSFVFVNNVEGSMLFISNYWNRNKADIIRGLITNAISSTLIWLLFTK